MSRYMGAKLEPREMNWLKNRNQEVDLFRLNESPNSEQTFFFFVSCQNLLLEAFPPYTDYERTAVGLVTNDIVNVPCGISRALCNLGWCACVCICAWMCTHVWGSEDR